MSSDQLEPIDRFRSRHLQPGEAVELFLKGTPPSKLDPAPSDNLLVLTDRRVAAYSYRRREREEFVMDFPLGSITAVEVQDPRIRISAGSGLVLFPTSEPRERMDAFRARVNELRRARAEPPAA